MNYRKIYDQLIQKRRDNPLVKGGDVYCETHHIVPKSEGGSNSDDNLVNLTAREHFVAHLLLMKIYADWKMVHAFVMMAYGNHEQHARRMTSRTFEKYKHHGNGRLGYKHRPETIEKMRAYATGRHPSEETRHKIQDSLRKKRESGWTPRKKGFTVSEETRRKMSIAQKGRKLTQTQLERLRRACRKKCAQYTKDGELVAVYDSQTDAAKQLGVSQVAINLCCKGVNKSCRGYLFKYVEEN